MRFKFFHPTLKLTEETNVRICNIKTFAPFVKNAKETRNA